MLLRDEPITEDQPKGLITAERDGWCVPPHALKLSRPPRFTRRTGPSYNGLGQIAVSASVPAFRFTSLATRPVRMLVPSVTALLISVVAAPTEESIAAYLRDVRPVLQRRCFSCHGAVHQKGGLRLDTATAI